MKSTLPALLVVALSWSIGACSDQVNPKPVPDSAPTRGWDDGEGQAAATDRDDTPAPAPAPAPTTDPSTKAPACTSSFGDAITPTHGRLDGTVRAVILPGDSQCKSDNDHVIVQIDADGATYQIWINVQSTLASDPNVRFLEKKSSSFAGGTWAAGWHDTGTSLDYFYDLGVHASSFTAMTKADLGAAIAARVETGAKVSVFADGFTTNDGAHKVHRNSAGADGALVLDPSGAPTYLLFSFSGQTF